MPLPTVTEANFPCRIAPFTGRLRVKITSFGRIADRNAGGIQGSITGMYSHAELWTYVENTLAHTGYDQDTGLRFDIPGRPSAYLGLPYRIDPSRCYPAAGHAQA